MFVALVLGCKKMGPDSKTVDWDAKKIEIANKVKTDLNNVKALLPFTIS